MGNHPGKPLSKRSRESLNRSQEVGPRGKRPRSYEELTEDSPGAAALPQPSPTCSLRKPSKFLQFSPKKTREERGSSRSTSEQQRSPEYEERLRELDRVVLEAPGKPEVLSRNYGNEETKRLYQKVPEHSILLRWTAPSNASENTEYQVEASYPEGLAWVALTERHSALTQCVNDLTPGQKYVFRVVGFNRRGPSLASVPSEPFLVSSRHKNGKEAPQFLTKLRNTVCKQNEKVEFSVKLRGNPTPEVTWTVNKSSVSLNQDRFSVCCIGDNAGLTIESAEVSDTGQVRCTATNLVGSDTTFCSLFVSAPARICVDSSSADVRTHQHVFPINGTLRLTAGYTGHPLPEFTWYRNNTRLNSSDDARVVTSSTDNDVTLSIGGAREEDTAVYKLRAVNEHGSDMAEFGVAIKNVPEKPARPRITEVDGNSVKLEWSHPSPGRHGTLPITAYLVEIWKDSPGSQWQRAVEVSGDTTSAQIAGIRTGRVKFRISAENQHGYGPASAESGALTVPAGYEKHQSSEGVSAEKATTDVPSIVLEAPEEDKSATYLADIGRSGSTERPLLTSQTQSSEAEGSSVRNGREVRVRRGSTAELRVSVSPDNSCVKWYKNKRLLSQCEDERYRVFDEKNGTESVFSIDRVRPDDAGLYSVVQYDKDNNKTNATTEITLIVSESRPLSPPEEFLRSQSLDERETEDRSSSNLQRSHSTEDPSAPRPSAWPLPGDGVLGALALSAASVASDVSYPRDQLSRAERIDRFLRRRNSSVFKQPLEDGHFTVGAPFNLHVELLPGYQDCQVRWYHNGAAVCESARVTITRERAKCSLHVTAASSQDAGKWSCALPEMTGSPTTVALLKTNVGAGGVVLATSTSAESLSASLPHTLQHYSIVDSPQLPRRSQTPSGEVIERHPIQRISSSGFHPPTLCEVLSDRKIKVGDKMVLSVKVANPESVRSVSWQHKGRPVIRSDRYLLESDLDSGHWSLSVVTTDLNDDSEWRVVLKSDRGTVETWCNVTLAVPRNYRRPRFMENLRALLTEEGLVSFECKVVGYPTPTLRWFKDGHELKPGDVYQLSGANSLGKYSCVALNCMGSAESTAELTLSDIEGQLTEDERVRVRTEQLPPRIISGLAESTEVKLGHAHAFVVEVTSYPDPEVVWLHNNVPVTSAGTIEVYRETPGRYRLDFQPAKIADQGEWRCVATNPSGSAETKTMLLVSVPAHFRAPYFLLPLRAALTSSGSVDLECKVIGTPQPVLHWYKDGKELKAGDIHKITAESPGASPFGEYVCEAVNCMGTTHSIATIFDSHSSHNWSEGRPTLPPHIEHYGVLRDISLSTINEERTSQLTSSEHSEEAQSSAVAVSETSVQVDGADVTVSVYGSDQLSRQEIQQVVQHYTSSSPGHQHPSSAGESISFSYEDGRSHPSLHVVKDQDIGGSVQLSATVIDLVMEPRASPAYDDTRTETGVDDLELEDTQLVELTTRPHSVSSRTASKAQRTSHQSDSCKSGIGSDVDANKSLISSVDSFHTADQMEPSLDSDDPTSEQVTPVPNDPELESSNASTKSSSNDEDNPLEDVLPKLQEALKDFEPPPPKRSLLMRTYSSTECPPIIEEDEAAENDSSSSNVEATEVDSKCLVPAEPLVTSHRQRPLVLTPSGSMQSDTEEVISVVEAINTTQADDKNKIDQNVVHACVALLHAVTTNEMLPKEFMSDIGRDLCSTRTQQTISSTDASLRAEKVMQVFMTNVKMNLGVVEELEQVLSPEYAGEQLTEEAKFAVQGLITALELASVGAPFTFPKISLPTERILSSYEERMTAEKILAVFRTLNLADMEQTNVSLDICHEKEAFDSTPKEELFSDISSISSGSFALEKTFSDTTKFVARKLLSVMYTSGVNEAISESECSEMSSEALETKENIEPSSDKQLLENLLLIAKSVVQESHVSSYRLLEIERAVSPSRACETCSPAPQLNVDQVFSYISPIVEELGKDDFILDVNDLDSVQASLKNAIQVECHSSMEKIAKTTDRQVLQLPEKESSEEVEVDDTVNALSPDKLTPEEHAGGPSVESQLYDIENLIIKMENNSSSDSRLHQPVTKSLSLEGRQLSEENNSAMSSASVVTVVSLNQIEELEDQFVENVPPPYSIQSAPSQNLIELLDKADQIQQLVSKCLSDPQYANSDKRIHEMVDSFLESLRQGFPDFDHVSLSNQLSSMLTQLDAVQKDIIKLKQCSFSAEGKKNIECCIGQLVSCLKDSREAGNLMRSQIESGQKVDNSLLPTLLPNFSQINEYLEKTNDAIRSSVDTHKITSRNISPEKRILMEKFSDFEKAVTNLISNARNQLDYYDSRGLVSVSLIADFQQSLACLVVSLCENVENKNKTEPLMAHMAETNSKISSLMQGVENDLHLSFLDSSEEASSAFQHYLGKHRTALNSAIDRFDGRIFTVISNIKEATLISSEIGIDAFVSHSELLTTLLSDFLMSLNITKSEKDNIQRASKILKKISNEAKDALNKLTSLLNIMPEYSSQNHQTDLLMISKQTEAAFERLVQKFNNCLAISIDEKDLLTINFHQMKSALQSNVNTFVECCRNGSEIKSAMLNSDTTCKYFKEIVNQMRSVLLLDNPKGLTNLVIIKIQEMTDYLDKSNSLLNSSLSAAPETGQRHIERSTLSTVEFSAPSNNKQPLAESSSCLHSNVQTLIDAIGDGGSLLNCEVSVQASLRVSEVLRRYIQEATLVYGTELPNEKLKAVSKSFDALNAALRAIECIEYCPSEIEIPAKVKNNLEIAGSVLRQAFQNMTILIEEGTGSATETRRIIDVQLYNIKIAVEKLIGAVAQYTSSLRKEQDNKLPLSVVSTPEHRQCVTIMKDIHGVIVETADWLRANSCCKDGRQKLQTKCLQFVASSMNEQGSAGNLAKCIAEKLNTIIDKQCSLQGRYQTQTLPKRNLLINSIVDSSNDIISNLVQKPEQANTLLGTENNSLLIAMESLIYYLSSCAASKEQVKSDVVAACKQLEEVGDSFVKLLSNLRGFSDESISDETENLYANCLALIHLLFPNNDDEYIIQYCQSLRTVLEPLSSLLTSLPEENKNSSDLKKISNQIQEAINGMLSEIELTAASTSCADWPVLKPFMANFKSAVETLHKFALSQTICETITDIDGVVTSGKKSKECQDAAVISMVDKSTISQIQPASAEGMLKSKNESLPTESLSPMRETTSPVELPEKQNMCIKLNNASEVFTNALIDSLSSSKSSQSLNNCAKDVNLELEKFKTIICDKILERGSRIRIQKCFQDVNSEIEELALSVEKSCQTFDDNTPLDNNVLEEVVAPAIINVSSSVFHLQEVITSFTKVLPECPTEHLAELILNFSSASKTAARAISKSVNEVKEAISHAAEKSFVEDADLSVSEREEHSLLGQSGEMQNVGSLDETEISPEVIISTMATAASEKMLQKLSSEASMLYDKFRTVLDKVEPSSDNSARTICNKAEHSTVMGQCLDMRCDLRRICRHIDSSAEEEKLQLISIEKLSDIEEKAVAISTYTEQLREAHPDLDSEIGSIDIQLQTMRDRIRKTMFIIAEKCDICSNLETSNDQVDINKSELVCRLEEFYGVLLSEVDEDKVLERLGFDSDPSAARATMFADKVITDRFGVKPDKGSSKDVSEFTPLETILEEGKSDSEGRSSAEDSGEAECIRSTKQVAAYRDFPCREQTSDKDTATFKSRDGKSEDQSVPTELAKLSQQLRYGTSQQTSFEFESFIDVTQEIKEVVPTQHDSIETFSALTSESPGERSRHICQKTETEKIRSKPLSLDPTNFLVKTSKESDLNFINEASEDLRLLAEVIISTVKGSAITTKETDNAIDSAKKAISTLIETLEKRYSVPNLAHAVCRLEKPLAELRNATHTSIRILRGEKITSKLQKDKISNQVSPAIEKIAETAHKVDIPLEKITSTLKSQNSVNLSQMVDDTICLFIKIFDSISRLVLDFNTIRQSAITDLKSNELIFLTAERLSDLQECFAEVLRVIDKSIKDREPGNETLIGVHVASGRHLISKLITTMTSLTGDKHSAESMQDKFQSVFDNIANTAVTAISNLGPLTFDDLSYDHRYKYSIENFTNISHSLAQLFANVTGDIETDGGVNISQSVQQMLKELASVEEQVCSSIREIENAHKSASSKFNSDKNNEKIAKNLNKYFAKVYTNLDEMRRSDLAKNYQCLTDNDLIQFTDSFVNTLKKFSSVDNRTTEKKLSNAQISEIKSGAESIIDGLRSLYSLVSAYPPADLRSEDLCKIYDSAKAAVSSMELQSGAFPRAVDMNRLGEQLKADINTLEQQLKLKQAVCEDSISPQTSDSKDQQISGDNKNEEMKDQIGGGVSQAEMVSTATTIVAEVGNSDEGDIPAVAAKKIKKSAIKRKKKIKAVSDGVIPETNECSQDNSEPSFNTKEARDDTNESSEDFKKSSQDAKESSQVTKEPFLDTKQLEELTASNSNAPSSKDTFVGSSLTHSSEEKKSDTSTPLEILSEIKPAEEKPAVMKIGDDQICPKNIVDNSSSIAIPNAPDIDSTSNTEDYIKMPTEEYKVKHVLQSKNEFNKETEDLNRIVKTSIKDEKDTREEYPESLSQLTYNTPLNVKQSETSEAVEIANETVSDFPMYRSYSGDNEVKGRKLSDVFENKISPRETRIANPPKIEKAAVISTPVDSSCSLKSNSVDSHQFVLEENTPKLGKDPISVDKVNKSSPTSEKSVNLQEQTSEGATLAVDKRSKPKPDAASIEKKNLLVDERKDPVSPANNQRLTNEDNTETGEKKTSSTRKEKIADELSVLEENDKNKIPAKKSSKETTKKSTRTPKKTVKNVKANDNEEGNSNENAKKDLNIIELEQVEQNTIERMPMHERNRKMDTVVDGGSVHEFEKPASTKESLLIKKTRNERESDNEVNNSMSAPMFKSELKVSYCQEDDTMMVECQLTGHPAPDVSWLKNNVPLPTSKRFRQRFNPNNGQCQLVVRCPCDTDSGRYCCVAVNCVNQATLSQMISVPPRRLSCSPETEILGTTNKTRATKSALKHTCSDKFDLLSARTPTDDEDSESISDRSAVTEPVFTSLIDGGATFRRPAINWRLPGWRRMGVVRPCVLFVSRKMPTTDRGDADFLAFISSLKERQKRARSSRRPRSLGFPVKDANWSSGSLEVLQVESSTANRSLADKARRNSSTFIEDTELSEAMSVRFIEKPDDMIYAVKGGDVTLTCVIQGTPKPKVSLHRGRVDVLACHRAELLVDGNCYHMHLRAMQYCDSGTYCIHAQNNSSQDRSYVLIRVKEPGRAQTPDWHTRKAARLMAGAEMLSKGQRSTRVEPGVLPCAPRIRDVGEDWVSLHWSRPLECGGGPVLSYRVDAWLRGEDAMWQTMTTSLICSAELYGLRRNRCYIFRVTPRNKFGWGEGATTEPVVVGAKRQAPVFRSMLAPVTKALLGGPLVLQCQVESGETAIQVVWLHEGVPIPGSSSGGAARGSSSRRRSRVRTSYNRRHGQLQLVVSQLMMTDAGSYTCQVSNTVGATSSYSRLQVVEREVLLQADSNISRALSLVLCDEDDKDDRLKRDRCYLAPFFLIRPRDRRAEAGCSVRLTCQVTGWPAPEVNWLLEDKVIQSNDRASVKTEENYFHSLEIYPVKQCDIGKYTVRASNQSGEVQVHFNLAVDNGLNVYRCPTLSRALVDPTEAVVGSSATLQTRASAHPAVSVIWRFDGRRLRVRRSQLRGLSVSDEGACLLQLAALTQLNSGHYSCTISNEAGSCTSSCQLVVKPAATQTNGSPPVFLRHPASSYVHAGDPLTISCQVTAQPLAEVTLCRVGSSSADEEYVQNSCELTSLGSSGVYLIRLSSVSAEDQDNYRLIARNEHGTAESSVFIRLLPPGGGGNDSTSSIFVRELEDVRCCDGDDVTLVTCFSSASLRNYTVQWEKDGVEVPDCSEDYRTDQTRCDREGTVECRLTVAPAYIDDEGQYVCVVTDLGSKQRHLMAACVIVDESDDDVHVSRMLAARDISPPTHLSASVTSRSSVDKSIRSPASAHPPSSHLNMANLSSRLTAARSRAVSEQPTSSSHSYGTSSSYTSSRQRRLVESPHFLMAPHDRTAQEGESVTFKCSVTGSPSPATSWYHDTFIIRNTEKHRVTEIGEERMLTIRNIRRSDAGVYKVTLENDSGVCHASCRLIVLGKSVSSSSAISTSSLHHGRRYTAGSSSALNSRDAGVSSSTGYSSQSRTGSWRESSRFLRSTAAAISHWDHDIEMIPTECPSLLMDDSRWSVTERKCRREGAAPVFVRPLSDITVNEGSPCKLDATVCGSDPIFVDWLRDGDTLLPDCDDFSHVTSCEGNRSLVMPDTYVEDSGVYSCQATNSFGSVVSSCRLTVNELTGKWCEQSCTTNDRFSQEVEVVEGANLRFWVRPVDGMRVKWILNGNKVKKHSLQTERIRITNDENGSSLELTDAQFNDTGALTVSVITPFSDWQSTVSLHVIAAPTNGHSSNYCYTNSPLSKLVTNDVTDCNGHTGHSAQSSVVIVNSPESSDVLLGQKVSLVCQFKVISDDLAYRPEVNWNRAGQVLVSGERIRIERNNDSTCMTLSGVTADDSGKYEVQIGPESRVVSVSVLGPPDCPAEEPHLSRTPQGCLSVSWRGPAYDGGSAVTGYRVNLLPPGQTSLDSSSCLESGCRNTWFSLSPQQTEQLQAGCQLYVCAYNKHGVSHPGAMVTLTADHISDLISPSQHHLLPTSLSEQILQEDVPAPFNHRKVSVEKCEDFDERFNVQEELGKGRFGTVHKVVERSSGTRYAAKRVKCIRHSDRARVEDEIAMMNDLQHPRLLQLAAAFHCGKQIIMLLEYVSGGELFERVVADDFTLTEHQCALFMQQICSGMQYMHEANIMHLDLKPENILCLTKSSHQIKIIDFGLARRYDNQQPVQAMQGTPEFVPPEVINYEPLTLTSDMWSVGVICYILLSGLSPFMGDDDNETFINITRSDYDFDDESFSNVSEAAKDFISHLLVKQQQYRMTAAEACNHEWVTAGQIKFKANVICKEKLKKFIIRRKWQKTGTAIRAIGRLSTILLQRSASKQQQPPPPQQQREHVSDPPQRKISGTREVQELSADGAGAGDGRGGKRDSVYSDRSDSGISDCSLSLVAGPSMSMASSSTMSTRETLTEEIEEDATDIITRSP